MINTDAITGIVQGTIGWPCGLVEAVLVCGVLSILIPWSAMSDSDIWGSEDEGLNADVQKLRRVHNNQGYLDGVTQKKEETLQQGFDTGYPDGAQLGIQVGRILGALQLLAMKDCEQGTRAKELLQRAKTELHISKVLSWKYFTEDLDLPTEGHALIKQWQETLADLQSLDQEQNS